MIITREFNGTRTIAGSGTHGGEFFFLNENEPLMSPILVNERDDDRAWQSFMSLAGTDATESEIQAARSNYIGQGWYCFHYEDTR